MIPLLAFSLTVAALALWVWWALDRMPVVPR